MKLLRYRLLLLPPGAAVIERLLQRLPEVCPCLQQGPAPCQLTSASGHGMVSATYRRWLQIHYSLHGGGCSDGISSVCFPRAIALRPIQGNEVV